MIQIMKLVKYKYLSVNSKKKKKRKRKQNKRTRRQNEKIKTSINKIKCINCQKMFYQIAKNEKYTIKNKTNKNYERTCNNVLSGV